MKAYLRETIVIPFVLNDTTISTVVIKIMRLSDGFWLDFNDLTFKNSTWTSDTAIMTEDSNKVWKYVWTTPQLEDKYQVIFIDNGTTFQYTGPIIEVNGNLLLTVIADTSNSATTFKTDLVEATNDYYKAPSLIKFINGNVTGQVRRLALTSSYNGTSKFLTVDSIFTAIPDTSSKCIVINQ